MTPEERSAATRCLACIDEAADALERAAWEALDANLTHTADLSDLRRSELIELRRVLASGLEDQ